MDDADSELQEQQAVKPISWNKAGWLLWIPGTALILLSWADVVGPTIGWIGFAVAAIGYAVAHIFGR